MATFTSLNWGLQGLIIVFHGIEGSESLNLTVEKVASARYYSHIFGERNSCVLRWSHIQ